MSKPWNDDDDCTEDSFVASLSLDEDEKTLFERIKKSVPYYHHQMHEETYGVKGILASFDYKTIDRSPRVWGSGLIYRLLIWISVH